MMQKAGYIQRTGRRAIDRDGNEYEVIEIHILGTRYAVRFADIVKAIPGRVCIQVDAITREWGNYLGVTCGLAHVSASGKALNIELFDTGNFTVSLAMIRSVLYRKQGLAVIVRIPEQPASPAWKIRRLPEDQQRIGATV